MGFLRVVKQRFAQLTDRLTKTIGRLLLSGLIGLFLFSCANRSESVRLLELPDLPSIGEERRLNGSMSEVAPPAIFSDLDELIADVRPQIVIAFPKSDQTLNVTDLTLKLNLRGLSIYKDEILDLGPHLQIILDNRPAQSIYSLDEPVEFSDLAPGSHTLRVIAVKPWGESFKNEEAFAQTTFHVFSKTNENTPDLNQPQLVYGAPQGTYGAQPILLDFYLNNAPLHLLAASDPELTDWRIRCDVNEQSFVFDQWQPIYLKGFKPGQNWAQLTLIDEQGNPIENAFNSTVRVVNFDPEQRDTLARMIRGELTVRDVGQIVVANYEPPIEIIAPPAPDSTEALNSEAGTAELEDPIEEDFAELENRIEEMAQPEASEATADALRNQLELEPSEPELPEPEPLERLQLEESQSKKEPLKEDRLEEDRLEEAQETEALQLAPSASEKEDALEPDVPGALLEVTTEEIPQQLEADDTKNALEEVLVESPQRHIAPIDDLDDTVDKAISDEALIEAVEIDELEQTAEDVVPAAPLTAEDGAGFFAWIKTFWKDLEESQLAPATEPDVENTATIDDQIEASSPSDQLLVDSPLLIRELQPSDLN